MAQARKQQRSGRQARASQPPRSFALPGMPPVPDLAGPQKRSYEAFIQAQVDPGERQDRGLQRLLREALGQAAGNAPLESPFTGYVLDGSAADLAECRRLGRTYAARLAVHLRGPDGATRHLDAGEVPLMTGRGTFLIAGQEKVVVGCLQAIGASDCNDLTARRLRLVGEQLEEALGNVLTRVRRDESAAVEVALAALAQEITAFFANSRFVRAAEDTNPLSLLSQVRRVVQTTPGKEPGYDARCVHATHFGRLCLLETPEGERIGVNLGLAVFADVDSQGRLLTPYRRSGEGAAAELLPPEADAQQLIGDLATPDCRKRYGGGLLARAGDDLRRIEAEAVDLVPVSPMQALGASAALIPLLAHDDANRALMGTNMQKQAVPLLEPEAPIVATGMEEQVARDSGSVVVARCGGVVTESSPSRLVIRADDGSASVHDLAAWLPAGATGTPCWRPLVQPGDRVAPGQPLAGGPATDQGLLALGRNVLLAYLPWEGYNFEDGIVVSDRLVREGYFDSVKTCEFTVPIRPADGERLGGEHLPGADCANLGPEGIVSQGVRVQGGEVLVARAKAAVTGGVADASLRLPYGQQGTVSRVEHYRAAAGDALAPGVAEFVRVVVECRRPLQVGDKLCNRHGAKGVVTLVLPEDQMPRLPDGRAVEMLLDPLSLPSRMNLGSVLEAHLGMAAHGLGCTVVTPGFNGATVADIEAMLVEAGLPRSGMFRLADGRTGRLFDQETTVGYVYIMKLEHLVEDKCQARNTGHYLPDTEQPASGRRHHGGQRIGLMETWALQGHGAARVLQEMLTLKSDDVGARAGVYEALAEGTGLPEPTVPHSVRRLVVQLRGLCLDLNLLAADGRLIDVFGRDAAVDNAVVAMLELAPAERILAWSAGEFPGCPAGGAVQSPFRQAEGLALRHLVLAIPVQHPWRGFVANLPDQFPAITVLPVLPSPLCPGSQFDRLYAAVIEANDACRSAGHGSGAGLRLQEAVDQLLNALTRCLHGKQGWITAAISGKTVDYSARSVICPGPGLDYDTCSLPEAVAAVLFEPLVVGALVRGGQAASAAEAKERLAQREPEAMAALRRVAGERCVILHRAPVLHRLGMQAFRVRLAAEHVIRVHPLPLVAFNGDFDGDEMDAFLPLGEAAQAEAWATARSSRCQLSPANGTYVAGLTQDMVLGCFYATGAEPSPGGTAIPFQTIAEVATAHEQGRIGLHETIAVAGRRTTVGRALFNQLLPPALGWLGVPASKAVLQRLIEQAWRQLGADAAAALADALMRFGFHQATLSGMSLGKDTFRQFSGHQACLDAAWHEAAKLEAQAPGPAATDGRSALVSHWLQVVDRMGAEALGELAADRGGMNPLHLMLVSGARGSRLQVRQHLALRGLMALPDNRIFSAPVTTSFIRGHSPFEYFAATFGARRGLADTAVKTADAGFLFKRIMNAVQDIVVGEGDCGCEAGVVKAAVGAGAAPWLRLAERIAGRTALRDVRATTAGAPVLVPAGTIISTEQAAAIEAAGVREVAVRSPVTCQAPAGVCAACYGLDLATWQLPQRQQAIGVLAAQSIGEPATQLTMRTFHPGAAPGQSGKRDDILGGLPQIDRLFECWQRGPDLESPGYRELVDLYQRQGPVAAAEHLLVELQRVYRQQGVRIDDRHFEVVLRQMLRQGLRGVTTVAAEAADFIAAGTAYGGIPALARAAARKQRLELTSIRNCTAFGKPIPAPGRPALAGQP